MRDDSRLKGRVGSRWELAIEWDVPADVSRKWLDVEDVAPEQRQVALAQPWYLWLGSLWLWADGHPIGRPFEIEQLGVGLTILRDVAEQTGKRVSCRLTAQPSAVALQTVMDSIYGSNGHLPDAPEPEAYRFEVMPKGCPFFDGWEAILVEDGPTETLIWRKGGESAVETATWRLATFGRVVNDAIVALGGNLPRLS